MTTREQRKQLIQSLQDKEMRGAFVEAHIETGVAFQIKANRTARKLTQKALGERADGMKQTAISRLEGPSEGLPNLDTLKRLASAFDVALIVRFVPFSELVNWSIGLGEQALEVPSFSDDAGLAQHWESPFTASTTHDAEAIPTTQITFTSRPHLRAQTPFGLGLPSSQRIPNADLDIASTVSIGVLS